LSLEEAASLYDPNFARPLEPDLESFSESEPERAPIKIKQEQNLVLREPAGASSKTRSTRSVQSILGDAEASELETVPSNVAPRVRLFLYSFILFVSLFLIF
jgi:hypothetical protein